MEQVDLIRRSDETLPVANREEIISRYKQLRKVGWDLNGRLVKRLSRDVLDEGGAKLGILQGNMFVLDTEDEMSILMDYCIYDVRQNGRNAIEQYLIDLPPDPASEEMTVLRARQHSIYSLFVVESVERGLGVIARDLVSRDVYRVVDMGLGISGQPGLVLATRLLHHDGFSMSSGAALPIGVLQADLEDVFMKDMSRRVKRDDDGSFDPASLIRICLKMGGLSHTQYIDPLGPVTKQQQIPNRMRAMPVGRNSPCPCGSGKKFKRCCIDKR